ncbi:MAG: hypothetical protein KZQ96_22170 [Candidatus Thiodiazotropha sp. (ex Lucinoma borealis)]|nr:hypothetical protein [Candidatus Thiodiazotropha sp. (ex Lucinoma borealis)]
MEENFAISGSKAGCKKPATAAVIHFPGIHRNSPGSLAWLRERGLLFPSDLAHDYEAIRKPRGPYAVSLLEDLR